MIPRAPRVYYTVPKTAPTRSIHGMAQQVPLTLWDAASLAPPDVQPDLAVVVGTITPGAIPVLPRHETLYGRSLKPAMDRIVATLTLLLALPLVLVVGAVVRLTLGRGVIYKQLRAGRHGQPFTMYKFRTMQLDRRKAVMPFDGVDRRVCHKRDDDPRHTPVGRFLRRASLDELPQLWNVMKGDMSLVGPRPELLHIVAGYEPWQHERHQVKPGLTGFWQISDRAGGLAYKGVGFDIDYLDKVSFRTDLMVLLRTIPVTIRRTGS
ncbi:MAG: sugar transferase [Actinobacteria bacterium]|nr:sugar transferase [Actinomycetota bacterium]